MQRYPATLMAAATLTLALLSGCDANPAEISQAKGSDPSDTSMIKLSLAHPANKVNNDYELLFATDATAVNLGVCVTKDTPTCTPGQKGYFASNLIYTAGGKNFFKPASSALLQNGLVLQVVATDANSAPVANGIRNVQFNQAGATTAAAGSTPPAATTPPATTPTPPATTPSPPATTPTPPAGGSDPNAGGSDANAGGTPPGSAAGGGGGGW